MAGRCWSRVVTIGSVQQERPHPAMFVAATYPYKGGAVYAGTKAPQLKWALNLAPSLAGKA